MSMRMLVVVALVACLGCTPAKPPESAPAATPAADSSAPAVETVELARGERVESHGLGIMLRGTKIEHQADGGTLLRAQLDVRKGDQQQDVSLERAQPGEPKFVEVFGLELALEAVDAMRKPSTAQVLVRP